MHTRIDEIVQQNAATCKWPEVHLSEIRSKPLYMAEANVDSVRRSRWFDGDWDPQVTEAVASMHGCASASAPWARSCSYPKYSPFG